MRIVKIKSIADLQSRCQAGNPGYEGYRKLADIAARNLGGVGNNWQESIRWIITNANETSEEGVVEEINFVRDLVS